ncbi:hypothetical protein AX16_006939 [Volvariella volvacea WC 439]|nr:hypothetical protein AX16_006939 [Volvariella volvacea WC 439]
MVVFIEPQTYRAVIDDVIANIKPEFDEFGVPEEVIAQLQDKWERKVIASHVAEFETPQPQPQAVQPPPIAQPHHHAYAPMMMATHPYGSPSPYALPPAPGVKTEPAESRYMLAPGMPYMAPSLPGPPMNGRQLPMPHPGGQAGVLSFTRPAAPAAPTANAQAARAYAPPAASQAKQTPVAQTQQQPQSQGQQAQKIPQVDGPSESEDDDGSSPPPMNHPPPRTSHPSLPQPTGAAPKPSAPPDDSEAINSDLDDSDTEGEEDAEEGGAGETDIVFCTYDKVARVKNKWKCVLKDGMIHVNGKDYLFAKCTGEFEW